MKKLFITSVTLALFLISNYVHAQDISFEASVNTNKLPLVAVLQLSLTFNGAQNVPAPELPAIDGFDARYLGPSTQVSIVNGQYSSSVAHNYNLFPQKVGKFQIPSISVDISGKTYTSESIDVEVFDTPGATTPSVQDESPQEPLSIKDKIFLTIEVPKTQAYLNEKIPVTIKLFIAKLSVRDVQYPEFKPSGFLTEEFQKPKQYSRTLGGVLYDVVEFNTYIYPTRTGELTIDPAKISCNVLYRSAQRQSPFDGFFDNDFFDHDFGGLFGGIEKYPVNLQSADFTVTVLPLPEEGKPQNFSGAVGQFNFSAQTSPQNVNAGDPVTLRMTLEGDGNLKAVEMPSLKTGRNFKVYDPQIKEEGGKKILEQVVIPTIEGSQQIPQLAFSYFDPQTKIYLTITQGPFDIEVNKSKEEESFKVVEGKKDAVKEEASPEDLGRDLIFIKEKPGNFQAIGYHVYKTPAFGGVVIISFLIFVGFSVAHRQTHRLKTDAAYARKLRAPKKAKQGLEQARQFMTPGQQKEFYDAVFKTLQDYFGNKFHLPGGSITVETIAGILKGNNKDFVLERLRMVFSECEMVRYAAVSQDNLKMKEIFARTQEIIDAVERV